MIGSGEYIGRDAAIEAMYKDAEANPNHTFWTSQFEALKSIPAADVRPVRRGKWIGTHDGFYYSYSCSECGYEALYKENTKDQVCSEFCPNCGADMREPLKGTDMGGGIRRDDAGNVIDWGITGPPGDVGKTKEE